MDTNWCCAWKFSTSIQLNYSFSKVEYISFSAHVDYIQNSEFIEDLKPLHLILVHGDSNEMSRLRMALQDKYSEKQETIKIHTPRNCEKIELYFRGEKMAKVRGAWPGCDCERLQIIGKLATKNIKDNQEPETVEEVVGIVVSRDFQYHVMDKDDLTEYTDLVTTTFQQRLCLSFHGSFELLQHHLRMMYGCISGISSNDSNLKGNLHLTDDSKLDEDSKCGESSNGFRVFDTVNVTMVKLHEVVLEWEGNSTNDMIADSVISMILQVECSPASVKRNHTHPSFSHYFLVSTNKHHHHHSTCHQESNETCLNLIEQAIREYFEDPIDPNSPLFSLTRSPTSLHLVSDGMEADVDTSTLVLVLSIFIFSLLLRNPMSFENG